MVQPLSPGSSAAHSRCATTNQNTDTCTGEPSEVDTCIEVLTCFPDGFGGLGPLSLKHPARLGWNDIEDLLAHFRLRRVDKLPEVTLHLTQLHDIRQMAEQRGYPPRDEGARCNLLGRRLKRPQKRHPVNLEESKLDLDVPAVPQGAAYELKTSE